MIRSRRQLEVYLAREVLGKELPRKPPNRASIPGRGPARDERYKAWIRTLPSAVSGLYGCEAAHTGRDGGMAQKASDYSVIPLTPEEHREYHRIGKYAFARKYRIDLDALAARLYAAWRAMRGAA